MITDLLRDSQHLFGDIFDFKINAHNAVRLDLSKDNKSIRKEVIHNSKVQEEFITNQIKNAGARVGVGGYLENRSLYQRSPIFDEDHDARSIHLGIDLWIEAGTKVLAPYNGEVFSVKNNKGTGDYGPTLILKHSLGEIVFYTL